MLILVTIELTASIATCQKLLKPHLVLVHQLARIRALQRFTDSALLALNGKIKLVVPLVITLQFATT